LETKEILESIENNIENKYQITNNLKNLIGIAKILNLRSVFEWAYWELNLCRKKFSMTKNINVILSFNINEDQFV